MGRRESFGARMVFENKKSLKALAELTLGSVPRVEQSAPLIAAAELRIAEVRQLFESATDSVFDRDPPRIEVDPVLLAKIAGDVAWLLAVLRKGWR